MDDILINPIVGEITEDKIVFLITTSRSISLHLYIDGMYHSMHITNSIIPTRIVIETSSDILSTYTWIKSCSNTAQTSLDTRSEFDNTIISEHRLSTTYDKMIFLSCDMPEADTQNSLWNRISTHEKTGICFHLGDNIYGDHAYKTPGHDYDTRYVETWSRWSPLLNNFSHMMIADDHEITNEYNYNEPMIYDVKDQEDPNNIYGTVAGLSAYDNYQTSLLLQTQDNPGFFIKKVNDDTTVYALSRTIMGMTPLDKIEEIKSQFSGNVILAISSAPLPLPPSFIGSMYETLFGSYGWKEDELTRLYDICFDLLETRQVKRIILIGGDLHYGISGVIIKGKHYLRVYVTSGITAHPTITEYMLSNATNRVFSLGDYNIVVTSQARRNYLTIALPLSDTHPGKLIYSDEQYPKDWMAYFKVMSDIIR